MWKCENVANANVANSKLSIGIVYWQHFHIGNIAAKPPPSFPYFHNSIFS